MSTRDDRSEDTSFALTSLEKDTLAVFRSYSKKYENKIAEEKTNFAEKGSFGLWWDAYGIFNSSDPDEVTAYMERYRELFKEIDDFTAQVEKGDRNSYKRLIKIYKEIEDKTIEARHDAENAKSSAVYRMLTEFLDEKFKLDHNLKKVECIVLNQRMNEVSQTCEKYKETLENMNGTMDRLINEKRSEMEALKETLIKEREEAEKRAEAIRRVSDERLKQVLKEAEERSEASRRESDETLQQVLKEAEQRSEASRRESEEKLKQVLKEAEEKADDRIQKMKEENEKLRLEAEKIRKESDEKLRKAVEEANRRSETRVQAMAEQNRAALGQMVKMLESMGLPRDYLHTQPLNS